MNRFASISLGLALVGAGLMVSGAQAATFYDTTLTSPGVSVPAQGTWYDGTGNPQGGFTVEQNNGIELGMRAKLRQSGDVIHSTNNVYEVPVGSQVGKPTYAAWNYEFSINLRPNGVGSLTLADVVASLKVTDVTTGDSFSVNPFSYWSDDAGYGASGRVIPATSAEWSLQQSENPAFGDFPLTHVAGYTYDMNAAHSYQFDLSVSLVTGAPLASQSILVNAVTPLPSAAGMGLGLVGLLGLSRRRKA